MDAVNSCDLYCNPYRASAEVKALTLRRIADLDRKMAELAAMRAMLVRLAESCHGDDRPECPIIENPAQRGALEELPSPVPSSGGS
jgi:MerR family transcriptional regulator, copper efflux regulator